SAAPTSPKRQRRDRTPVEEVKESKKSKMPKGERRAVMQTWKCGIRNSECGMRWRQRRREVPLHSALRIPHSALRRRASFTIIELLVVITIIAVLATITLGVVGGLLGQARDTATKATLSKIQGLIDSRNQALQRLIMRNGFLTGSPEFLAAQTQ